MRIVHNTAPLAALALYGQPFGFTREDVDELRAWAAATDGEWGIGSLPETELLRSIADRIDALLPPETVAEKPEST